MDLQLEPWALVLIRVLIQLLLDLGQTTNSRHFVSPLPTPYPVTVLHWQSTKKV